MEDLSDYIKRHYFKLHKKPENAVKERIEKMNEQRKNERHDKTFVNRNIPENSSPFITPKEKRAKATEKSEPKPKPVSKRWEMLQQWKAEKENQKKLEKQKKKPLFKVCHVPVEIGLPKLDNVNFEIKGKSIKSKFAPANHKFKPPSNIKPIDFEYKKTTKSNTAKSAEIKKHQMTTRSQALKLAPVEPNSKNPQKTGTNKNGQKKTANKSSTSKNAKKQTESTKKAEAAVPETETRPHQQSQNNSLLSPDYPAESHTQSCGSDDEKTPEKSSSIVYVSPYVTISRGKNSARKEYEARKMGTFEEKSDTKNCTSPTTGAAYFTLLLNNQRSRLLELCEQWNQYKEKETLPEAVSMIDVAIGQTNLLLTKKFMQFQGLIDACDGGAFERPVTCEDLHGFWDLMYLQIDNVNKRFENLNNLKSNNWEEILPEVKKVVTKKTKVVKNVKASAGLRAAIDAARRKKGGQSQSDEICIETKTPQTRRSSRIIIVKTDEKTNRKSSPGLMMMKVAQFGKTVNTPGKSILKTDGRKSAKSQSKAVIFRDEVDKTFEDLDNVENDANIINSQTRGKTPLRRSRRLSKTKLF